jgi:plasmid stabilization system protein ParE
MARKKIRISERAELLLDLTLMDVLVELGEQAMLTLDDHLEQNFDRIADNPEIGRPRGENPVLRVLTTSKGWRIPYNIEEKAIIILSISWGDFAL